MDAFALSAAAVAACVVALWAVSVAIRDASIVDIFWGAGFVVVAVASFLATDQRTPRSWLLLGLTAVWGGRLTIHLFTRNVGKGEDFRYVAMRRRWGSRFPWVSLATVFGLQGVLMWTVSVPVQAGISAETPASLGVLGVLGAFVWLTGFLIETIGDAQLRAFKADPANKGKLMDRGLWSWTRHPNYFGDSMVWWGLWLVALPVPFGWATVIGPAVMTFLLVRVSGVAMLERTMRRREGWDDYARRTSAFIPRPPR